MTATYMLFFCYCIHVSCIIIVLPPSVKSHQARARAVSAAGAWRPFCIHGVRPSAPPQGAPLPLGQ